MPTALPLGKRGELKINLERCSYNVRSLSACTSFIPVLPRDTESPLQMEGGKEGGSVRQN
jgi:hypothetical protein